MNKEIVPYEEAKALEKFGFDEPCIFVYLEQGNYKIQCSMMNYPKNIYRNRILAPLWQQVFDWFVEKHLIYSYINYDFITYDVFIDDMKGDKEYSIITLLSEKDAPKLFSVYEARVACLRKLIQIVNDKKRTN